MYAFYNFQQHTQITSIIKGFFFKGREQKERKEKKEGRRRKERRKIEEEGEGEKGKKGRKEWKRKDRHGFRIRQTWFKS